MADDFNAEVSGSDLNDEDVSLMIGAVVACEENEKAKYEHKNDAVPKEEDLTTNKKSTASSNQDAVLIMEDTHTFDHKPEPQSVEKRSLNDQYDLEEQTVRKNVETLRKLKLVKNYKEKNNIKTLEVLIQKWRKASQLAITELLEYAPKEPPTSLGQLITYLGIDPHTIKFDSTKQDFIKESQSST